MQPGDIITNAEAEYIETLEQLWDQVTDAVAGGRLTEADLPDDYWALVRQIGLLKLMRTELENDDAD